MENSVKSIKTILAVKSLQGKILVSIICVFNLCFWICQVSLLYFVTLHYFCSCDKQSYCFVTFTMNGVGFEALMLWATIGQELFSCFATTLPDPPSCVYLFQKGKNSHFDLYWPLRLKSVGLLLLFWCFKVEMYNTRTCALKRKKINSMINLNFMWVLCFFFQPHPEGMFSKRFSKAAVGGNEQITLKLLFRCFTKGGLCNKRHPVLYHDVLLVIYLPHWLHSNRS